MELMKMIFTEDIHQMHSSCNLLLKSALLGSLILAVVGEASPKLLFGISAIEDNGFFDVSALSDDEKNDLKDVSRRIHEDSDSVDWNRIGGGVSEGYSDERFYEQEKFTFHGRQLYRRLVRRKRRKRRSRRRRQRRPSKPAVIVPLTSVPVAPPTPAPVAPVPKPTSPPAKAKGTMQDLSLLGVGANPTTDKLSSDAMARPLRWVVCGRSDHCENEEVHLAEEHELHEVRCCSDSMITGWKKMSNCDVWGGSSIDGKCHHRKNFGEAEMICGSVGARLCTKIELERDCAKNTGCQFNEDLVWSLSTDPTPVQVVPVPKRTKAPTSQPIKTPTSLPTITPTSQPIKISSSLPTATPTDLKEIMPEDYGRETVLEKKPIDALSTNEDFQRTSLRNLPPLLDCPDQGSSKVPCAPANLNELCDIYSSTGSFFECYKACKPSYCCIHDSRSNRAARCIEQQNCIQYTACYVAW
eukprot:CAMPEP_0195510942 /NCGR_PEP_ID=MMETSP0794_2-20130614/3436_1 /TAXON_ID=515487 /ORGANISM="Stephanopyxis turris, Strain CCMP 815" /LENGTH=468 /DNA_ID=CAMNT_0040638465 /DNA_START=72 /DNA_END=1475 /DNA_ORIENTATION=-